MSLYNKITERDLFNFVFFNNQLDREICGFLNENEKKFDQISFYKALKENLLQSVDNKIKEKIAERISAYKKSPQIFTLFPVKINIENGYHEMPILAAASKEEEQKVIAKSFVDDAKTFVVRMLKMDNKIKLYPFTLLTNEIQKLKITLHPSQKSYTVYSDKHLELDFIDEIESISVEALN